MIISQIGLLIDREGVTYESRAVLLGANLPNVVGGILWRTSRLVTGPINHPYKTHLAGRSHC
jgi:hypothetical protein